MSISRNSWWWHNLTKYIYIESVKCFMSDTWPSASSIVITTMHHLELNPKSYKLTTFLFEFNLRVLPHSPPKKKKNKNLIALKFILRSFFKGILFFLLYCVKSGQSCIRSCRLSSREISSFSYFSTPPPHPELISGLKEGGRAIRYAVYSSPPEARVQTRNSGQPSDTRSPPSLLSSNLTIHSDFSNLLFEHDSSFVL
jgi:hypothetical protein